jgi:hypothetical protein
MQLIPLVTIAPDHPQASMAASFPAGTRPDSDLMARAASGDEHAMAELYDRYGQLLYTVA